MRMVSVTALYRNVSFFQHHKSERFAILTMFPLLYGYYLFVRTSCECKTRILNAIAKN